MQENKSNPYPHRNFSLIADYLEEIILLVSNEKGLVPIQDQDGYEDIEVTSSSVEQLTVPEGAVSASLFFEADDSATKKDCIIRFKENGDEPTSSSGQSWGHRDIFNPSGKSTLENLRFIGIESGKTNWIRVQYYSTAQK